MLQYTIMPEPHRHLWHITLSFEHVAGSLNILKLANWVAGSYMIRDFSRHMVHISARRDNQHIEIKQLNKNTWQLPEDGGNYQIHYTMYANDLSVRASLLDTECGFIDGACLFLYKPDRKDEPCHVQFFRLPEHWHIQTTMPRLSDTSFQAQNYTELTDHPFEMGAIMEVLHFTACNIPHRLVLSGFYPDFDRERLLSDCIKICEHELKMFPAPAPFTEYAFLLHLGNRIYGGLEHISSTALHADRHALPQHGMGEPSAAYTELLGLIAHEYFHAWNVKSIKPSKFQPYDLDNEIYTEQLWAYEGITSYYDDLTLVRSGVISVNNYLNLLANNLTRVYRNAGRKQQTLAQSSFAAWHKYYKQDENSPNAITSYYQHGALFALCLDLIIRANSTHNLDLIMQTLYQYYVSTGKGTEEGEWQKLAIQITNLNLHDFFTLGLHSTQDLPVEACLETVGLELRWLPENRTSGNGGVVQQFPETIVAKPELGCRFQQNTDGAVISHVFSNGSAELATLKPQDKVIAVNGFACTDFAAQAQTAVGDIHTLHFFRHGVLLQTDLTVQAAEANTAYLRVANVDLLNKWLFNH